MIGITETWIHASTRNFDGELEVQGYKMFKKDWEGKEGGGVLLYVREYLNPVDCKIKSEHEMLGVTLNCLSKCIQILLVYRIPNQNVDADDSLYSKLSNQIKDRICLIIGDFNCPRINWEDRTSDAEEKKLIDFANRKFLTQWGR